ncbi:hypothetical protein [Oceanithermus sp.]|uniref:hypothetical protein n=1 Tax=Oceanithermus sp. TaxID=2268145 RepID=UPI00257B89A0|nr:hypothetical protein [Oceanithermus sp.]
MTSALHRAAIAERMTAFLRRRAKPRHLQADEQAAAAELEALVRRCASHAPTDPEALAEWWPRFELRLEDIGNGRHWPTPKEVSQAAATTPRPAARGMQSGTPEVGSWAWRLDVKARRIAAGRDYCEADVWGPVAVELLRSGRVTEGQIDRARRAFVASWIRTWGEAEATRRAAALAAEHATAERLHDQRRQRTAGPRLDGSGIVKAVARVMAAASSQGGTAHDADAEHA